MARFDICSIGSAVQDTFVRTDMAKIIDFKAAESGQALCLPLGAKLDVSLMQHEVGGGAVNTSVSFSRLGLHTAVLTRIGQDFSGRMVREVLRDEGVSTEHVLTDKEQPTGQSMLLMAPDGNRTVLVARGAAKAFEPADISEALIQRCAWIYVSSVGGSLPVLRRLFALCQHHRVRIAWNPGALELAHGQKALEPLLRQTDVLLLNREEAAGLTGLTHPTVDRVMRRLIDLISNGDVVVTNGAEGASAFDGSHIETLPGNEVSVVDATGAGDSFGSGFVGARILGAPMDKALSYAVANAGSVIGQIGAQAGLLRRIDLSHQKLMPGIEHRLAATV